MVVLDRKGRLVGRVVEPVTAESRASSSSRMRTAEWGFNRALPRGRHPAGRRRREVPAQVHCQDQQGSHSGRGSLDFGARRRLPVGPPAWEDISVVEDTDLFKKIIVQPYFDLSDLDQVAVFTADLRDLS